MEKNQALKSFESFAPKEYLEILRDQSSLEEKLMAIYTKALKPEVFKFYRPIRTPSIPSGWLDEYELYQSCKPGEKSAFWKEMMSKFATYILALDNARAENASHKYFLTQMRDFFNNKNCPVQTSQITQRLYEFESLVAA